MSVSCPHVSLMFILRFRLHCFWTSHLQSRSVVSRTHLSEVFMEAFSFLLQNRFVLEGALEIHNGGQNARFGSALAPVPDLNGDAFNDLVVGAPLEDDHKGAIYVFFSQQSRILRKYKQVWRLTNTIKICSFESIQFISAVISSFSPNRYPLLFAPQRIAAVDLAPGLQYFGRSVHGTMDMNNDGSVDLAVGSLGAVVLLWLVFYPEKRNRFHGNNGSLSFIR